MIGNDDGFRLTLEDSNIDFVSSLQFIVFLTESIKLDPVIGFHVSSHVHLN